jgi:hypothetical protein
MAVSTRGAARGLSVAHEMNNQLACNGGLGMDDGGRIKLAEIGRESVVSALLSISFSSCFASTLASSASEKRV